VIQIRFIADVRRHRGVAERLTGRVQQYALSRNASKVEWITSPDQDHAFPGPKLEAAAFDDESLAAAIVKSLGTQADWQLELLSYDNYFLNHVKSLSLGAIQTTHFGNLFAPAIGSPSPAICSSSPVIGLDEASLAVQAFLEKAGHTSPVRALPLKDLRPRLTWLDRRFEKRVDDPQSKSLISSVVAMGRAQGWLDVFQGRPGVSGTEAIYLKGRTAVGIPVSTPTVPEGVEPETHRASKYKELEGIIKNARIGAKPRTRDFFFTAVEEVVTAANYLPLLTNDLLDVAFQSASQSAKSAGYEEEPNWTSACRSSFRLLSKAGCLLDQAGNQIDWESIGGSGGRIVRLDPEFRLRCDAHLSLTALAGTSEFRYDKHLYHLGLLLYGTGNKSPLSESTLKEKADLVLTSLEQAGRIQMDGERVVLVSQLPRFINRI